MSGLPVAVVFQLCSTPSTLLDTQLCTQGLPGFLLVQNHFGCPPPIISFTPSHCYSLSIYLRSSHGARCGRVWEALHHDTTLLFTVLAFTCMELSFICIHFYIAKHYYSLRSGCREGIYIEQMELLLAAHKFITRNCLAHGSCLSVRQEPLCHGHLSLS